MSEAEQDYWLAEHVIDEYESGDPTRRQKAQFLLSALGRIAPRARFRTAWKALSVWQSEMPCQQAPAAPPEVILAMCTLAVAMMQPEVGTAMLLCYAGLLRAREGLLLMADDLLVDKNQLVIVSNKTKTGLEQKVVVSNPAAAAWLRAYIA